MIDALDEEVEILFQILQDDVPLLPPTVRLFVTSRDTGYLRSLKQDSHFYLLNLDIREESNLNNIQTFAHHALRKIARMEGWASFQTWPEPLNTLAMPRNLKPWFDPLEIISTSS